MYSDVSQNAADGSEYLVHEIRKEMNVISTEAQPSAGMFLFSFTSISASFFVCLLSLGVHRQPPPPLTAVPSASAYFMCLFP